ncbi:hypothetical protein OF83DRAFT_302210 [Amylostereum chailletii]|nr:hypothetical protein OF83DRAFT_302210 [Amylostereum chailletii]
MRFLVNSVFVIFFVAMLASASPIPANDGDSRFSVFWCNRRWATAHIFFVLQSRRSTATRKTSPNARSTSAAPVSPSAPRRLCMIRPCPSNNDSGVYRV